MADGLDSIFTTPPKEARPLIIWQWMDGVVSKEGITADLEAYSEAGLGGVQQFLIGGRMQGEIRDTANAIGTDNWKYLMRHAIQECSRLGLSFGTHNCPGWSSSAYPAVRPEDSMQKLVWTDSLVKGGQKIKLDIRQPKVDSRWNYYEDIALLAMPVDSLVRIESIINLTGKTSYRFPTGQWRIIRFGHTTNGKTNGSNAAYGGEGLECDKMSRDAVRKFWQGYPSMLIQLAGDLAGKTFKRIEIDSYEAGPQNWTPCIADEFLNRSGYELTPWLTALAGLVVNSKEETEKFKKDWQETITDLYAECYYGEMCRLASSIPGMQLLIQPYGHPLDTWKCASQGESLLCAEFWVHSDWGWAHIPQVVSAAHRLKRKMIYAEGFTCTPLIAWQDDPNSLKPYADRAFCQGINRLMLHAGAQNPWPKALPGMTFGKWGTQFSPGQTWWRSGGAKEFFGYLSRCQALLQYGDYVDDYTCEQRSFLCKSKSLQWIHRKDKETDIFFIANPFDSTYTTIITLDATGRIPEVWYPDDGRMEDAKHWQITNGQTSIALKIDPFMSFFIVLRRETHSIGTNMVIEGERISEQLDLSTNWTLRFPEGMGAPDSLFTDSLFSWNEAENEGIKYYSGTVRYTRDIKLDKIDRSKQYILELGEVKNLARVFINGKEAAHLWKKPFCCDITSLLREGKNQIEVDVTNLWVNRMIGDEQHPDDMEWGEPFHYQYAPGNPAVGRFLSQVPEWLHRGMERPSKNRFTIVSFKFFEKESPLLPSGLKGPVILKVIGLYD